MRPEDVQEIVNAYGAVLAEPTALGVVRDLRSLPYSKEEIKSALKFALSVTTDPAMGDQPKTGDVALGDFQELSDVELRALQLWNNALRRNVSADAAKMTRLR